MSVIFECVNLDFFNIIIFAANFTGYESERLIIKNHETCELADISV